MAKGYYEVKTSRGKSLGRYRCEHCEFEREDEAEVKDHVKKPGLHPKGGYRPRGGRRAGEVSLKEDQEGGEEPPSDSGGLTEAEQAEVAALVKANKWDDLADMADTRSGTKEELATQIVLANREEV